MTSIPVEKDLLEELIDLKLRFLYDEIDKILNKWKYDESSKFLQDGLKINYSHFLFVVN